MTSDVVAILADVSLAEAAERLADSHVSAVAVIDHQRQLLGVLSISDILTAQAEAGDGEGVARLWTTGTVADLMTPRPLTVSPDLEIREAALQMDYADVHRLFVEEGGKLVGVISRSDINRGFAAGRV